MPEHKFMIETGAARYRLGGPERVFVITRRILPIPRGPLLAALCLLFSISAAGAAPIQAFNTLLGDAMRHYRWGEYYFRTGNIGLARLELDAFAAKTAKLSDRFAPSPPQIFAGDPNWRADIESLSTIAKAAVAASEAGEIERARELLAPLRARVGELRRRNGLFFFADCIDAANTAFGRLWRVRHDPPDFTKPIEVDAMRHDLAVTIYWYRRCHQEAPAAVRGNGQFQRLMETSIRSLNMIWEAARNGNTRRIIGVLREVRSSDRLLYLQFP